MEKILGAHNAAGTNQHKKKEVRAKMLPEPTSTRKKEVRPKMLVEPTFIKLPAEQVNGSAKSITFPTPPSKNMTYTPKRWIRYRK